MASKCDGLARIIIQNVGGQYMVVIAGNGEALQRFVF